MLLDGNTVLITGGASGIGFGLAERFLAAGSQVILCGRREERLRAAREKHPELQIRVCDVGNEGDRHSLADWAASRFPALNVLVNNAGIQVHAPLTEPGRWERFREEIAINLDGPVHLSMLLLPHLLTKTRAAIVNITSGLSFVPLARAPVYSATKAALHSFTRSLRHQLAATSVEVIEIIPPAVNTDLGGVGLHTFGVGVEELLDDVLPRIQNGEREVAHGFAVHSSQASRPEIETLFERINATAR